MLAIAICGENAKPQESYVVGALFLVWQGAGAFHVCSPSCLHRPSLPSSSKAARGRHAVVAAPPIFSKQLIHIMPDISISTIPETKWQLKLPGNGGGAATLFTYISCTFRHFPCEIGRCFFGINKHDRHLARSRKDRSERGPHHAKGTLTRYVGELFGRPVGSISCHSV